MGNGPQLLEKLSKKLPPNVLVRLVDTAKLSISEQISIMQKTDYFIGIHGAGFFLTIFLPDNAVVQEVLLERNCNYLLMMSRASGHKTYSNVLPGHGENINGFKYVYLDPEPFVKKVLEHFIY